MVFHSYIPSLLLTLPFFQSFVLTLSSDDSNSGNSTVSTVSTVIDLNWYPPNKTDVNNLSVVINGTGTGGFIFNSSFTGEGEYGEYNWCDMPHVRRREYVVAKEGFELVYVEVIHRHHKRTPYAANTFPVESYPWYCNNEGVFFYGSPLNPAGNASTPTYWSVYTSPSNPFPPQGFNGTCQLPQITRGGLDDSYQHGLDLAGVYRDLLQFLPASPGNEVLYRVTNNVITSQVAGMVVEAMFPFANTANTPFPLLIQPDSIDSLEPTYSCPSASSLYSSLGSGSTSPTWLLHLNDATPLYAVLDAISGVPTNSVPFHMSFDHYFDNLSSRLCDAKPLPCQVINGKNSTNCITQTEADQVFRLGEYEYDFQYRSANWTFQAAVAHYGVFVAELASNIRAAGASPVKYRHNVAHDGSISSLLSILQLDVMVWPGMGAEVVFEVFSKAGTQERYLRILWGGKVLRSSNPMLGLVDMVPVDTVLAYFDGLVGRGAALVPGLCGIMV